MAITSIGAADAAPPAALGLQDFLKILLTQLTYQDPLKPMDNQAFMAQMAQFTSLEQTQRLNDKLELLIANQAALQSVGLIGRMVEIASEAGTNITGTVTSLSLSGTAPLVTVTTSAGQAIADLPLSRVLAVR